MPKEKIIFGADYVLIRDELQNYKVKSGGGIVVTTGASDPCGVMSRLDQMLAELEIKARFLVGKQFNLSLNRIGYSGHSTYTEYSPKFLASADIIISTFGVTIYEALFFKKPTISIAHSKENAKGSELISEMSNSVKNLGYYEEVCKDELQHSIENFYSLHTSDKEIYIDGLGANRISELILAS